ncbi:MAG: PIG-L family deacetylase [Anaerolineaceae bacterium]|nr:PIG-L family deacetylase [Anaerolineaceae bacterium]
MKEKNINGKQQTMLVVVAHPDDETFGMGGTLAYYANKNVKIHLIVTTNGAAGEVDPQFLEEFNSIAELRAHELHCAANTLGLSSVDYLIYRDSGMSGSDENQHPDSLNMAPLDQVAENVLGYVHKYQPQVIITHDPMGGYGHPDHIKTHHATMKAFQDARELYDKNELPYSPPQKIFFNNMPRKAMKFMVRIMPLYGKDPKKYGRNGDIDLAAIVDVDYPIHTIINYRSVEKIRSAASACHASQGGASRDMTFFGHMRRLLNASKDNFTQVFPSPVNGKVQNDLFANIEY